MSSGFGPDDAYNAYDAPLFKRGEVSHNDDDDDDDDDVCRVHVSFSTPPRI
jgi:hypothetical protein